MDNYIGKPSSMSPADLEKILEHLPEPNSVKISIWGEGIDYSALSPQADGLASAKVKIKRFEGELEKPSKEQILEMYRRSCEQLQQREEEADHNQPGERLNPQKRIDLKKATWYLDNGSTIIEITPPDINITYEGEEPSYISQILKEFPNKKVKINMKLHKDVDE